MDAFQVFQQKAREITGEKQRTQREKFKEFKEPFLALRKWLEAQEAHYHEVRPRAVEELNKWVTTPWQDLGFFNPPGAIAHYLRELNGLIGCNGKPFRDLIQQIDGLSIQDFPHGPSSPVPMTIREDAKGLEYGEAMEIKMRALREECEKYAGRIEAGGEYLDVKIAGEIPAATGTAPFAPKVNKKYSVLKK